jgi:hypothetical protein
VDPFATQPGVQTGFSCRKTWEDVAGKRLFFLVKNTSLIMIPALKDDDYIVLYHIDQTMLAIDPP